jgi:hypothetical protein
MFDWYRMEHEAMDRLTAQDPQWWMVEFVLEGPRAGRVRSLSGRVRVWLAATLVGLAGRIDAPPEGRYAEARPASRS